MVAEARAVSGILRHAQQGAAPHGFCGLLYALAEMPKGCVERPCILWLMQSAMPFCVAS